MTTTTEVTGGCLCGAVRYSFASGPLARRACWCRDCQYLAAGNATVNLVFRADACTVTGELGEHVGRAESGNTMRRRFCRSCGTPMFSQSSGRPEMMVVRAGTLDTPELGRPESFIWTGSAPSWGLIDESLANCAGQPPAPPQR